MNSSLQEKCDLLVENKKIIADTFKWNADTMNLAAALLFTAAGRRAESDALKSAEELLRRETGAFSVFRGTIKAPLLCKMLLSGRPEDFLKQTVKFYELLNHKKWFSSEYNALAAAILAEHAAENDGTAVIERTNEMYALMKRQHPWLTSGEDIVLAAILAATEADISTLAAEAERNYVRLKNVFRNSDAARSLSLVLAMNEKPAEEKCARVFQLYDGLKEAGHKYGSGVQLAALGTLTMLNIPAEQLVRETADADTYLQGHKGFGNLMLGSDMRRMYAAQMVLQHHLAEAPEARDIVLGSMLAFTIAMEIATIAMISSVIAVSTINSVNS